MSVFQGEKEAQDLLFIVYCLFKVELELPNSIVRVLAFKGSSSSSGP